MPTPDIPAALAALGLDPDDPEHRTEVDAVTEVARRAQLRARLRKAGHPSTLGPDGPTMRAPLNEPPEQVSWPPLASGRVLDIRRVGVDSPPAPRAPGPDH